jgi:DNA-binding MarR family transcriptional regulator
MPLPFRGPFLLVHAVARELSALLAIALRDAPLTADEFAVTSVLRLTGPLRAGELARLTGHRPTSLSNYLRRFEERGIVTRGRDPDDRRATVVSLTERGVSDTVACFPAFQTAIEAFRRRLAEAGLDESELLAVLESTSRSLRAAYDDVTDDPAP